MSHADPAMDHKMIQFAAEIADFEVYPDTEEQLFNLLVHVASAYVRHISLPKEEATTHLGLLHGMTNVETTIQGLRENLDMIFPPDAPNPVD